MVETRIEINFYFAIHNESQQALAKQIDTEEEACILRPRKHPLKNPSD